MSVLDDRELFENDTYVVKHEYGDFTPFYIGIAICSVIGGCLFILNFVCCRFSQYREYWQDRHTGNRWIQSMWVVTPHKNPPLDLTELKPNPIAQTRYPDSHLYYPETETEPGRHYSDSQFSSLRQSQQFMELQKRESDI